MRRRDLPAHRRWMIRAFAVGLAVVSIRIWIGLLSGVGPLDLEEGFAPGFWLGLSTHALVAELWLWWRPGASGRVRGLSSRFAAP